jgi:hypothetical protein
MSKYINGSNYLNQRLFINDDLLNSNLETLNNNISNINFNDSNITSNLLISNQLLNGINSNINNLSIDFNDSNITSNLLISNQLLNGINSNINNLSIDFNDSNITSNLLISNQLLNGINSNINNLSIDFNDSNITSNLLISNQLLTGINNKLTSDTEYDKLSTESILNVKPFGHCVEHNDWHAIRVNTNGKLLVEADLTESEIVLNTFDSGVNSNILAVNSSINTFRSNFDSFKLVNPPSIRYHRFIGNSWSVSYEFGSINSGTRLYLNNPVNSGNTYFVYNIVFSQKDNESLSRARHAIVVVDGVWTTLGTAVNVNNLKLYDVISDNSICGFGGSTINTVTNLEYVYTHALGSSHISDFQEEFIEIPEGKSLYLYTENTAGNPDCVMSMRFLIINNDNFVIM